MPQSHQIEFEVGFRRMRVFSLCMLLAAAAEAQQTVIAGYRALSDVSEHSRIDLDQQEMESLLDGFEFEAGFSIYANGKHSQKSTSLRTLQGFSTDTTNGRPKLEGEPMFDMYAAYWGSPTYADDFVQQAINGTGPFQGATRIARSECANKGSQYQNVWMYVVHELEDAINDCRNSDLTDNDRGVVAWDEGWAFYAGSLEGPHGDGAGFLGHELAEKRCVNFGTCTTDEDGDPYSGRAAANTYLLGNFSAAQTLLEDGECGQVETILRNSIVPQLTVPLIQGALRYVYLSDPKLGGLGDDTTTLSKSVAEGWAFTAAVLPQIDNCDSDAARFIRRNMDIEALSPVQDGTEAVVERFYSVLSCLKITCADIGGYKLNPESEYVIPPCDIDDGDDDDDDDDDLSGGAIFGIVVAAVFALLVAAFFIRRVCFKQTNVDQLERMEDKTQEPRENQHQQPNAQSVQMA